MVENLFVPNVLRIFITGSALPTRHDVCLLDILLVRLRNSHAEESIYSLHTRRREDEYIACLFAGLALFRTDTGLKSGDAYFVSSHRWTPAGSGAAMRPQPYTLLLSPSIT